MTSSGTGGLTPSLAPEDSESLVLVDERERAFGRYHLRFEIASGGMATVFLGRARGPAGFDRPVAVKRIHPHLAKQKQFVDMFLDEARLCARISHPNVCQVFDFGEVQGTYYLAMEYLVGQPFHRLLAAVARKPFLARTDRWRAIACSLIADACEGLHAAHELTDQFGEPLNVVHRDVSPHNIFVTYDGAVKVMDFGVAMSEGRLHQTAAGGGLKGKLAYMAPEQAEGGHVDRRVDVWALGVCLWEMLAMKRLFGGGKRSEVELLDRVVNQAVAPPSSSMGEVPIELDEIVMRALDRDRERRYPSAREFGRALSAFVAKSGIPVGLPEREALLAELFGAERKQKVGLVQGMLGDSTGTAPDTVASGPIPVGPVPPAAPVKIPELVVGGAQPVPALDAPPALELPSSFRGPPPKEKQPSLAADPVFVFVMTLAIMGLVGGAWMLLGRPMSQVELEAAIERVTTPPLPEPDAGVPEAVALGTLTVSAMGDRADVFVDGEFRGEAPLLLTLPAGEHAIELRPPRGRSRRASVTVVAGQTETLELEL